MAGFIYVLSNPAFEGLLKIGKSAADPLEGRVIDLYGTAVPQPFRLEFYAFVEDYHRVESSVHSSLGQYRPNSSREFFAVTVQVAIKSIRDNGAVIFERSFSDPKKDYFSEEKIKQTEDILRRFSEQRATIDVPGLKPVPRYMPEAHFEIGCSSSQSPTERIERIIRKISYISDEYAGGTVRVIHKLRSPKSLAPLVKALLERPDVLEVIQGSALYGKEGHVWVILKKM